MPKINQLPSASSVTATDLFAIDNSSGTATKNVTGQMIKDFTTADVAADVTDLKNAITDITGDTQIPLVANKYIDLSGSSVTMSSGVPQFSGSSALYSVGYMECSPGDEFCVSGTGGGQTRLWGFVDSSGNILEKANASVSANRLLLTAPTNAAYIIVHTNTNKKSYHVNHGSLLKDYVSSLKEEIAEITQSLSEYIEPFEDTKMLTDRWIIGNINASGKIESYTRRICTPYYMLSNDDITILNTHPSTSNPGIRIMSVLYDNDYNFISRTINGYGSNVTIPANTYFRLCLIYIDDQDVTNIYELAKYICVTNAAYNAIENAKKYAEKSVSVFAMRDKSRLISEYMLGLLNTSGNFAISTKRVTYADYMKYPKKIFIYLEHGYCATVCLYNNDKILTQRTNYTTGQTTLIEIPENTFFRVTIWNYIETDITDIDDVASRIYIWNPYSALYDDSECIAIMESFAVIGDSLSAGYAGSSGGNYGSEAAKTAGRNWPTYLGLRIGRPITNLSRGSSSAHDWRYGNVSLGVNINDADIDTYCYMLAIGVNDARQGNTIGTESDIATDPENNADTFYGNYDYVIRKLRSFANERISQAHIFAFTIPPTESNAETYNAAIRAIAYKYRNSKVHLIDINRLFYHQFLEPPFSNTWVSEHSRPIGYMMMANMIRTAINKYMMENIQWFTWTPWEAIT